MSLRLAALDAFAATSVLLAPNWSCDKDRLENCYGDLIVAHKSLRRALGIAPLHADMDAGIDEVAMLETLAARLARSPETALLAGAIIRAIGQHRAETRTKALLAAE